MFTKAIVRTPAKSLASGITTADLGRPDYERALSQHSDYVEALKSCGLEVTILDALESFPDSTFVEDTALLTARGAIVTNPGARSRNGEATHIRESIAAFYESIETIDSPGTVDAGDIMMVGDHFFIGLSARTNRDGADQTIAILESLGMTGSCIELREVLHLKTGVSYIERNNLVVCGEFTTHPDFQTYDLIEIDKDEAYSANCIWVNDRVLIPKGYPGTKRKIEQKGYQTIEVDVSEFQKIDGGLSCLSLRF